MSVSRLSPSSVALFKQCPRRFYYEKIEKLDPGGSGVDALIGSFVHRGLELFMALPAEQRSKVELSKILRVEWETFKESSDFIFCEMDEPTFKSRVSAGLSGYLKMEDTSLVTPVYLEREISVDIEGVPFYGFIDRVIDHNGWMIVQDYKGLACDTEIPTPSGFVKLIDLNVGDIVFDKNGQETEIYGKSKVKHLKCFKVTFDDLTEVVCDEEHLWDVMVSKRGKTKESVVFPIQRIIETMKSNVVWVPNGKGARPTLGTEPFLDPYVLGAWLGDGKYSSGEFTNMDQEVWDRIAAAGFSFGSSYNSIKPDGSLSKAVSRTILGLRTILRENGLLGQDKVIPEVVYTWSFEDRLELLRGLMDTDGSFNHIRRQCAITSTRKYFLDSIATLLRSLGIKCRVFGPFNMVAFNKSWEAYNLTFTTQIPPFHLSYKLEKFNAGMSSFKEGEIYAHTVDRNYKKIVSVEEVDTVPTVCVAVDSPTHTFLCTRSFTVTHNTGKVPGEKYRDDKLLQLKFYAAALTTLGENVDEIELLYVTYGERIACIVTSRELDEAKSVLVSTWGSINDPAQEWPVKTGPLCHWCNFKGICPQGAVAAEKYVNFRKFKGNPL